MSHQVVLARATARGWAGVHVRWGLPEWVLPRLHQLVTARLPEGPVSDAELAAALEAVAAEAIDGAPAGYVHFPDDRYTSGDGRVGPRSRRWGMAHELLYVLDPGAGTVAVSSRDACRPHQAALDEAWRRGGKRPRYELSTCPWGVRDQPTPAGGARHPMHAVPGCTCRCAGVGAVRFTERLVFRADDLRPVRVLAAMVAAGDGRNSREDLDAVAALLASPGAAAELYVALREQGTGHAGALEAALAAYAEPAEATPA